ncbi:MAG: xanthine dehydrogenase family protein subunit M [Xanthomonadales bacterium]|jgi:carbon-monoxide dehydrogenase medium subunit|nr:xanthine dehydrogenase family protein subunit M [Xanthomonadales bacterium]
MYDLTYRKPATLEEAARLLEADEDAQIVAGGMTLVPTLKLRLAQPTQLVDLSAIDTLHGIRDQGTAIEIGAMTRHADVAGSALVQEKIPALAHLASRIGDPQVRHRGTLGGSVANSDPAADYPAGVLGLGATIVTNRREIAADDFFLDLFETALDPGEILAAIRFPVPTRCGYVKFPNPASRYAIVGVFVADFGGNCRVAVTGAGPCAFRVPAYEAALTERFADDALAGIEIDGGQFNGDLHATPEYRAHLVGVMAKRAVQAAGG